MEHSTRTGEADFPAVARAGVVRRAGLLARLDRAARVTEVSAPAGSGKTVLLRSWISEGRLSDRTAWVTVQREERDPQRFWISVSGALRDSTPGSQLVRPLSQPGTSDLDGWAVVEWLLKDLAALDDRMWLVIDDVQELLSPDAQRQLELLIMRAPPELRFALAARHDLGLGLHRLRLEGELTEIRAADLRFTLDETRALFDAAGVELSEPALLRLHERTEGWAAGLRLAALSLDAHADQDAFVAEFSGTERTVAEYLLAEVLKRQPRQVRRMLLRTSILERVNGELADLLTGHSGGGRILQKLETAGAFVASVDAQRTWFRYHRLFADLLQFELHAIEPDEVPVLHAAAANWLARHGAPVEAVRHAQAAGDWNLAARVLADHWLGLALDGQAATARELLAGFPADLVTADAELTTMKAASEITSESLEEAERHLERAMAGSASVPACRRAAFDVFVAVQRLRLARKRNDLPAVVAEAQRLLALAEDADTLRRGLSEDVRGIALVSLGTAELLSQQLDKAERNLAEGIALARQIARPFTEVTGLAQWARVAAYRSVALAVERSRQAIELAQRHGWAEHQALSAAYTVLATAMIWQGELAEGERWLREAERMLRTESEPATSLLFHHARGTLELARGRYDDALIAFLAAGKQAELLVTPRMLPMQARALMVHTLLRAGDIEAAEQAISGMEGQQLETGEMRAAVAELRQARGDPRAAVTTLAPVLDGSVPAMPAARVGAFLVAAMAYAAAGEPAAADKAFERALDLAEPDGILLPFLMHGMPELLERYSRAPDARCAIVGRIHALLTSPEESGPVQAGPVETASAADARIREDGLVQRAEPLLEPLSEMEMRVLRFLPTNLTAPEIADELYLSVHTVKTHIRHIYVKLGVHGRREAVQRARALGLLAPAPRRAPAVSARPGSHPGLREQVSPSAVAPAASRSGPAQKSRHSPDGFSDSPVCLCRRGSPGGRRRRITGLDACCTAADVCAWVSWCTVLSSSSALPISAATCNANSCLSSGLRCVQR